MNKVENVSHKKPKPKLKKKQSLGDAFKILFGKSTNT